MSTVTIPPPTHREPEFLGQTVLVIGDSAGIGFETARRAGAEGAKVILTGRKFRAPPTRRHCCKTSLAKPRAPAAWCMESQAFRSAPRSSWKSFLS